jgi:cytochrome c oxidase subunit IV
MAQEKKAKDNKAQKHDEAEEAKSSKASEDHGDEHASKKEAHDDVIVAVPVGDHDHKPNRKEYWVIFVALLVLTLLEVGIAQPSLGISKTLMRLGLVGMALAKAVLVAMFYMHLKQETRVLRLTVFIPLATPALYAVVLISEAAWRLIR